MAPIIINDFLPYLSDALPKINDDMKKANEQIDTIKPIFVSLIPSSLAKTGI